MALLQVHELGAEQVDDAREVLLQKLRHLRGLVLAQLTTVRRVGHDVADVQGSPSPSIPPPLPRLFNCLFMEYPVHTTTALTYASVALLASVRVCSRLVTCTRYSMKKQSAEQVKMS